MSALQIRKIEKSFTGVRVLDGISLDVTEGGITAILGPSGCGKTTLLRLIAGFLPPDAGSIDIGGTQVSGPSVQVPPEQRRLGYLAQEGALFPHLTVTQNIMFGLPRRARRNRARLRHLLDLVSLPAGLMNRYPHELSGGQQQRVALARTLAPAPRLVLLDEPFSALDASLRAETRTLVAGALAASDVTTLLVTHDQAEALSFADQIAVLRSGRLAQVGSPQQVYDNPVDLPTAQFVGDTCTLTGTVTGTTADTPLGTLTIRHSLPGNGSDGPATLMLRPEQLLLRPGHPPGTGTPGVVETVEYFGHDCVATVAILQDLQTPGTILTCRSMDADHLRPGSLVHITVTGTAIAYR